MIVMSDRGAAIIASILKYLFLAFHKHCPKHIEGNLRKLKFSEDLIKLYWKAEKAKTKTDHNIILQLIDTKPNGI